ncbi:MAG: hypothetical protein K6G47_08010 [Clostridia bacterium]|nr:hypothetical protein [Clostridia bacterium]
MRYLFIISNEINSKELRKLEDTIASLNEDMRNHIELRYIQNASQSTDYAVEASEQSDDNVTIVVCGGDNVIHEVVNGLAYRSTPLAIIPLGSVNHFAQTITPDYLLQHPEKGVLMLQDLNVVPIDLVRIDSYDVLGNHLPVWSRYFINIASFGFETTALYYAKEFLDKNKKADRQMANIQGALRGFQKMKSYKMDYSLELIDSETNEICEDEEFLSLSICNGKYNNGCCLAPNAKIDDGVLDICVTENRGRLHNGKLFIMAGLDGKHVQDESVRMFKATSGIITCKDNSFQLSGNCDGELIYGHRIRFEVFPEALNLAYFPKQEKR